ncbi:MAG TPA: trypsin-like peptidase domain-containing protein [Planctomycetota bacterium]|nr:trypsin-like peptidase domain-containing protein [Planctomycetota bacterium]
MEAEPIIQGTKDHEGRVCPVCQTAVHEGEVLHQCASCGAVSHERCWRQSSGCQSYFCRRSGRAQSGGRPEISISREDTDRLKPEQLLPSTTSYPAGREGRYPKRYSKLAIIALLITVISVGLLGCVGMVLAAVALGLIANNSILKGRWVAVSTILLSVVLLLGWGLVLYLAPWNVGRLQDIHFRESSEGLKDVPEPIRSSMRANVLVRTSARGLLGRVMIGSGVIVSLAPEGTLILTNRHVIDPKYKENHSDPPSEAEIEVFFCGQEKVSARVRWFHPNGADLALLECRPADVTTPAAVPFKLPAHAPVGTEVFAVGNPMELGWTYTKGVISNVRAVTVNGKDLRVFQTQTPINEGNSGGGLYDSAGTLVGINTWTQSKGVAEGLSFAIAVDHASEVLTPMLAPRPPAEAQPAGPGTVIPRLPPVPVPPPGPGTTTTPAPVVPPGGSGASSPEGAR